MNIYTWIFSGLLAVALVIYIIGLIQRIIPMEKAAYSVFMPFLASIILSLLTGFLPDSHHIIFISALAFTAATIFMLTTLKKNKFFKFAQHFFFLITEVFWFLLFVSVYRIFKISNIFFILSAIIFIAGFVVMCVFIKKQSFTKYTAAIIQYTFAAIFCTTALICLIYEKRIFGILIFIGTLINLCNVIFETFQRTRPFNIREKTERVIIITLEVTTQALLGAGAILMQI